MNLKIIDYAICQRSTVSGLQSLVRDSLNYGWVPIGGIEIDSKTDCYLQVMVKYESYKNAMQDVAKKLNTVLPK